MYLIAKLKNSLLMKIECHNGVGEGNTVENLQTLHREFSKIKNAFKYIKTDSVGNESFKCEN